jgi:hypothetical protein
MTVKQLKERLEVFDEDLEVFHSWDYGNKLNTEVARRVSEVEEMYIRKSSYFFPLNIVVEVEDEGNPKEGDLAVLLLN